MTAELGKPPELAWLPVDKLDVDHAYQRTLETARSKRLIAKIAAEFSWLKFGALMTIVDGEGWKIIDGQHRLAAARSLGILHLPAIVHREAALSEQALAFVALNRDRIPVNAQTLHRAKLASGDDSAIRLQRICDEAGIRLLGYPLAAPKTPAGTTSAVPALQALLRLQPGDIPERAIGAVAECWRHQPAALRGELFLAAGRYLAQPGTTAEGLKARMQTLGIRRIEELIDKTAGAGTKIVALFDLLNARIASPAPQAAQLVKPPAPAPIKLATAPPIQPAPTIAPPAPDPKRTSEQDEIARFLATKGSAIVMSPEQVAAFLRDAGHRAVIHEATEGGGNSKTPVKWVRQPELDGKPCSLSRLYEIANELRGKSGLQPLRIPEAA